MRILATSLPAWLGIILLVSLTPSQAQDSSNSGFVSFRVLTFERVKGLKKIQLFHSKISSGEGMVAMHKNNFSGPYRSPTRTLQFIHPPQAGEDGGKPVSAGKVKIPDSLGRKVVLIALPADDKTYRFFPVADKFKQGGLQLINLTEKKIAGRLNKHRHVVKPRSIKNVGKVSEKTKRHSYPVEFLSKEGDKWQPLTSSYWFHEPDARILTFFFTDPKTKRIRIRSIRELPPVKEQP